MGCWRIASGREVLSSCPAIQSSKRTNSAVFRRTPMSVPPSGHSRCDGGAGRPGRPVRRGPLSASQAEGDAISAGNEFAAIQFIAGPTGARVDTVAHAAILTISAIPDALAVLLLIAAGMPPQSPSGAPLRRRRPTRRPLPSPRPSAPALKAPVLNVA